MDKIEKLETQLKLTEDVLELQRELTRIYEQLYLVHKEFVRSYENMFEQMFGDYKDKKQ